MTSMDDLYSIAFYARVDVDCFDLHKRDALSIMDTDGTCSIAIDPFRLVSEQDEKLKLAHELGHCMTGSFYNIYSPYDVRARHEYRADKWAVHYLMPLDELQQALDDGCMDVWNLAERFGVTEDFVKRAAYIYQCEGVFPA